AEDAPAEEAAASDRCGDPSKLASKLNIFNWADYMDPDILTQFEEECGVPVTQDIYSSNEDLIAKLLAGNSGYDLVFPSDYAVQILISEGLLAELDKSNIPNIENLDPNLMGLYYDPDNTYSVPYQWGTTGLAYNINEFPDGAPESWAAIFEPDQVCQHSGFVSMLDDEREAIGAALLYLGYSYNETSPEAQQKAEDLLKAQKDCLAGYDSDNFDDTLMAEEIVLAHAWSGAVATARSENENVAYTIPKEGGAIWQDNMTIPADAPNKYTAEVFINYILDPEIGAQLSNWTYYFTPNKASEPLLDEYYFDLLKSGGMLVDDDIRSRLQWIERSDESIIFSDTWTAVKAQ
ncbi:MAG: spermidine/putrescine ABC transporter substrate-binding protein, partial [Anaerolineae bacterium]|nr:spermidine/putrescine ABC transporter substrate-binding protein [Anaerolineae bacterium]